MNSNSRGMSQKVLVNIKVPWLSNTFKIVTNLSNTVEDLIRQISTFHLLPQKQIV